MNTDLMTQEESERVRDIMTRLTSYSAVEVPSELREVRPQGVTIEGP